MILQSGLGALTSLIVAKDVLGKHVVHLEDDLWCCLGIGLYKQIQLDAGCLCGLFQAFHAFHIVVRMEERLNGPEDTQAESAMGGGVSRLDWAWK